MRNLSYVLGLFVFFTQSVFGQQPMKELLRVDYINASESIMMMLELKNDTLEFYSFNTSDPHDTAYVPVKFYDPEILIELDSLVGRCFSEEILISMTFIGGRSSNTESLLIDKSVNGFTYMSLRLRSRFGEYSYSFSNDFYYLRNFLYKLKGVE